MSFLFLKYIFSQINYTCLNFSLYLFRQSPPLVHRRALSTAIINRLLDQ